MYYSFIMHFNVCDTYFLSREEPFNNFGSKLNPKTIVQNW